MTVILSGYTNLAFFSVRTLKFATMIFFFLKKSQMKTNKLPLFLGRMCVSLQFSFHFPFLQSFSLAEEEWAAFHFIFTFWCQIAFVWQVLPLGG